ncbi:hypothetical protein [Fusibacter sp. 3D3]|uniref:hypothetical protein n=1 Tax=Fusibacter sp. 3D3 TaxID=1048380 RepID=UPI0008539482|nr:hypothetical protein [Fusibacter sp. 3D3]GAU77115.1 hypothetical protein F3D3_1714 [Fusibacter sp. 3D3]
MKKSLLIGCIIISVGLMGLTGCAKKDEEPSSDPNTDAQNLPVSEPVAEPTTEPIAEPTTDPASGTSPKMTEEAAKAIQEAKAIKDIKSITLRDLEGNVVDRTFTEEEIKAIETAFNESFIMDTAYVEMIAGLTMNIELENGKTVFIHSYGQEAYIVATIGEGPSYHLGSELIGKILLEGSAQ